MIYIDLRMQNYCEKTKQQNKFGNYNNFIQVPHVSFALAPMGGECVPKHHIK